MAKSNHSGSGPIQPVEVADRRRYVEYAATFGLLLICASLVVPFFSHDYLARAAVFKWVYAAGALVFTVARVIGVRDPLDHPKVTRMRRMECWAGFAFIIAGACWFFSESRLHDMPGVGILALMRSTVLFTLVGAALQIVASWLIVARTRKLQNNSRS